MKAGPCKRASQQFTFLPEFPANTQSNLEAFRNPANEPPPRTEQNAVLSLCYVIESGTDNSDL